jgi:hypothetical protein
MLGTPMKLRRKEWLGCLPWMVGVLLIGLVSPTTAQEWQIPIAGNYFRTAPEPGNPRIGRDGALVWADPQEVFSVFFHIDRPARLQLSAELKQMEAASRLQMSVGETTFEVDVNQAGTHQYPVGDVEIRKAGYVRVDIRGLDRLGQRYAGVVSLTVAATDEKLDVNYVRNNDDNMFYWGRRGPSVHLTYRVPQDLELEYAYSEITVPAGEDPIGSYFMANGFGEGYFGFQVNSEAERRVLFSVWSPFQTDDPKSVPPEQRIEALDRGPEVKIGEFGNEGSGGQSYLVYPWQAGKTYRFLTRVTPDGQGSTIYSAWFGDKIAGEWRLIARFRRPQTNTHLRGFHSFLESFDPSRGHLHRRGRHHNVWVRDTNGQWHRCEAARLSVDGTGGQKHRLDFGGGVDGDGWFMENAGFFAGQVQPGALFEIPAINSEPPTLPN